MNVGAPHRVLQTPTDLEVLRVLAGTTASMSGRQVARLVEEGSLPTVQRSLSRLADLGVLEVSEAGRALMFSLNREHLAVPGIELLVDLRRRMLEAISHEVAALDPPPAGAGLFGSAARGDGDVDSDIDLLLVCPGEEAPASWEEQVPALADHVHRRTGNTLSVHQLSPADLAQLVENRAPILEDLERDYLRLAGAPLSRLLEIGRG